MRGWRRLPPPGSDVIHRESGTRGRVLETAEEARWLRPPFSTPPIVPYKELLVAWGSGGESWVNLEELVVLEAPSRSGHEPPE